MIITPTVMEIYNVDTDKGKYLATRLHFLGGNEFFKESEVNLLMRLENTTDGKPSLGIYQFFGGFDPQEFRISEDYEWEGSPFERGPFQRIVRKVDKKEFDSRTEIARLDVRKGDRLIVRPIYSERAKQRNALGDIVTLSGEVEKVLLLPTLDRELLRPQIPIELLKSMYSRR